jgi:hypothetical protein
VITLKYETKEEIPGFLDQSDNMKYLVSILYKLNWRWPKSRKMDETIKEIESTLTVAGIMYFTSQGTKGFHETIFKSELANLNAYYEQTPTKNALSSFHSWFKKRGTPKVWKK